MDLPVLEVLIGLVASFFLVSLIASGVVEIISTSLQKRSKDLDRVLQDMLSDGDTSAIDFKQTSVYKAMQAASRRKRGPGAGPTSRKPSYISARSFADGVIEGLVRLKDANTTATQVIANLPNSLVKERLTTLQAEAGDDLVAVKAGLEGWFDDTMDRLEGSYKRWSQWFLLLIGIAIAVALNVSAVRIADSLWNDAALRAAVADSAVELAAGECPDDPKTSDCPPEDKIDNAISNLEGLGLPIGWTENWADESGAIPTLFGMFLTGAAVMLGAPFWFDLLARLGTVRRSRGVPPKAADDQGSATFDLIASSTGQRRALSSL